jgi:hypothetical protein
MRPEDLSELELRVIQLEKRLAELEGRAAAPPPVPPPFIESHRTEPRYGEAAYAEPPRNPNPPSTWFDAGLPPPQLTWPEPPARRQTQVAEAEKLEMQFGRKVLPWLGAVAVSLGLIVLTSILVQSGSITPLVQFCLAVAACLGFLGLGEWLHSRKHPLTVIVLGLSSFGGFLTIISGATTFGVYSNETALLLLLVFSAVNTIYSALRRWQVFTGFGLAGGLGAALLALDRPAIGLTVAFVTGFVSAVVSERFKWNYMVWAAYLGTVAVVSSCWIGPDYSPGALNLYYLRFVIPSALMLAYILRSETKDERPLVIVPALWPVIVAYIISREAHPVWIGWGTALLVIAWLDRKRHEVCLPLLTVGLLSVTLLEPISHPVDVFRPIWFGLAVAGSLANLRFRSWWLCIPTLCWQVLSVGSWFIQTPRGPIEPLFWSVQLAMHAAILYSMHKDPAVEATEPWAKISFLALGLLPLSAAVVFTALRLVPIEEGLNITLSLLAVASGYSVVGLAARNLWLRYLGWIGWSFLVLKVMTTDFWELTVMWRSVTLVVIGLVALAVAGIYIRRNRPDAPGR